jgi:hypothetical protein
LGDPMNGWNRLFVVIAVCWAIAAPFWLMAETNSPVHQAFFQCGSTAYENYGTAIDSRIRLDMEKYRHEVRLCSDAFARDFVSLQRLSSAMIGIGDLTLGLVAWGFILIPLCLLWVVSWGLGKTVRWVVAGFRRGPSQALPK